LSKSSDVLGHEPTLKSDSANAESLAVCAGLGSGHSEIARGTTQKWVASVLFSSAMHAAVLVALALVFFTIPSDEQPVISALMVEDEDDLPEPEVTDDLKINDAESVHELNAGGQSVALPFSAPVSRTTIELPLPRQTLVTAEAASQPWSEVDVTQQVDILGSALGEVAQSGVGKGNGAGQGDGAGAFFGLRPIGKRFVFVMDCSKSMNHPHDSEAKTRFKRMKMELLKSVATMDPEMQFFIVFFNDLAIPMPTTGLAPAFPDTKIRFLSWANTIKAIGNTEPTHAMRIAMKLNPDVIYFLTDGTFYHRVEEDLLKLTPKHTVIHTFAFEEPLNDAMKKAWDLIDRNENVAARRSVTKTEFRKTRAMWQSHTFLQKLARKHKGSFHAIP
jgi:hypothetical protein